MQEKKTTTKNKQVTANTPKNVQRRSIRFEKGYCLTTFRQNSENPVYSKYMRSSASAKDYLQMSGLMASCTEIIPFAWLHMKPIQLHLLLWWKPISRDLEALIPSSHPASILRKSTSGRHRPVSYPDGPMTARYRFT